MKPYNLQQEALLGSGLIVWSLGLIGLWSLAFALTVWSLGLITESGRRPSAVECAKVRARKLVYRARPTGIKPNSTQQGSAYRNRRGTVRPFSISAKFDEVRQISGKISATSSNILTNAAKFGKLLHLQNV